MSPERGVEKPLLLRWILAFGAFWWDFLVGDTPEFLPGVAVVLGAAALAVHSGAPRFVVVAAVPVLGGLLLCSSVLLRRRTPR